MALSSLPPPPSPLFTVTHTKSKFEILNQIPEDVDTYFVLVALMFSHILELGSLIFIKSLEKFHICCSEF
jgi:hypothetical protein